MTRYAFLPFACVLLIALGCGPQPSAPVSTPSQPAKPTESASTTQPTATATTPTAPAPKPTGATVRGTVVHPGKTGQNLTVGYIELDGDEWMGDLVGHVIPEPDAPAQVESEAFKPRKVVLSFDKVVTYEFTGLPAGNYFVFARLDDGPAGWAKVGVKADATATHDFKLESGKTGGVEVKTPADFVGQVRLAPTDLIPADNTSFIGEKIATQLELGGKAEGGKVTIPAVPAGKYTLFRFPGEGPITAEGTVEVTAGQTAMAELQSGKK